MKIRKVVLCVGLAIFSMKSHSQMIVNDPTQMAQDAVHFAQQWGEMINQECAMLESLDIELREWGQKTQAITEQIEKLTGLTRKVLILYREIECCYSDLEDLRKDVSRSAMLSLNEKYTLYSRAQMLCYDVLKRRNDIDKIAKESQSFSYSENAAEKEERLDRIISVVREIRKGIGRVRVTALDLVNYKRNLLDSDIKMRQCLSLKLF